MAPLDPEFLAILRCPLSHAPLVQAGEALISTDPDTRRKYRIDDGIPVLLAEESEELDRETWEELLERAGISPQR